MAYKNTNSSARSLPSPHPLKPQAGLSIIEIMVALLVSTILLGGVIQIYVGNQRTSRVGDGLAQLQESARFAVDQISEDIRTAGYLGCVDSRKSANVVANGVDGTNPVNTAIRGFVADTDGDLSPTPPATLTTTTNLPIANSDVVMIQRASSASMQLSTAMTSETDHVRVGTNNLGVGSDQVLLISDCDRAVIFRVTAEPYDDSGDIVFEHDATGNSSNSFDDVAFTDTDNTFIRRFMESAYYVGDTGRTNSAGSAVRALYRVGIGGQEELVEGIEQIRVLYGETDASNGSVQYRPADSAGLSMADVTRVQIALLVSSTERTLDQSDDNDYQMLDITVQPAADGGTYAYPDDRRLRRVFTTTITLRNRRS